MFHNFFPVLHISLPSTESTRSLRAHNSVSASAPPAPEKVAPSPAPESSSGGSTRRKLRTPVRHTPGKRSQRMHRFMIQVIKYVTCLQLICTFFLLSYKSMSFPARLSCQPFISEHSPPEWPQQSCDPGCGEEGTEIQSGPTSESSRSCDSREPFQTPRPPSWQEERQEEQTGAGGHEKERQPQELHP